MKQNNNEKFLAGCSLTGLVLLFGTFLFGDVQYIMALWVIAGIALISILCKFVLESITLRNVVSLLLCLTMLGNFAIPAYATVVAEGKLQPYSESTSGTDRLTYLRNILALCVETYGLTPEMSDQDLANVYFGLDVRDAQNAWENGNTLMADAQELSDEELSVLEVESNTLLCLRMYNIMTQVNSPVMLAADSATETTVNGITFKVSGGNSTISKTESGSVVITGKGTTEKDDCGSTDKESTVTITIVNTHSEPGTVYFKYTKDKGALSVPKSDEYESSILAASNGQEAITFTTAKGEKETSTLTLNSIEFRPNLVTHKTTIWFDGDGVTVDGDPVSASGTTVDIAGSGAKLIAQGSGFLGWINTADNRILSQTPDFTFKPEGEMSIRAVYAATSPWFMVDDTYLVEGLAAATEKGKTIVLMNSATLPAGNYTIPGGDTLLIPFNDTNTLYTTKPGTDVYSTPSFYRTLTMAEGAHITVNGAISVSAMHSHVQNYNGAPTGKIGHIRMNSGSTITVNNGGALYTWGLISGSGSVTLKNGATAYESLQVVDWRGGSQSTSMKNDVWMFSQYYIQNVEVPLEVQCGATLKGVVSAEVTLLGVQQPEFTLLAKSGAMFNITRGSLTKYYNEAEDRIIFDIDGDITVSGASISISIYTIKTTDFIFSFPSHITADVRSGSNLTISGQDILLAPGAQVLMSQGASLTLSNADLYVYDREVWIGKNYVSSVAGYDLMPCLYTSGNAYGTRYTRTVDDLVDAELLIDGTLNATQGNIYTTEGGANIHSNGTGVANIAPGTITSTYQLNQSAATYDSISVTSAKLKNADGTYVETADGGNSTYTYVNGIWCKNHKLTESITTAATCISEGVKTISCSGGCGTSYTETIPTTGHTADVTQWKTDSDSHWRVCATCGTELEKNSHDFKNGKCECGVAGAFTVTWNVDGETTTTEQKYGEKLTLPNAPTKVGHTFLGWFTSQTGGDQVTAETTYQVAGETTYYAQWEIKSYTIQFMNDNGTEPDTIQVTHGTVPVYNNTPGKIPSEDEKCIVYKFTGWSTSPDGIVLTSLPKATEDAVYYAVYSKEIVHTAVDETSLQSDAAGHWHVCTACGGKADLAAHVSSGPANSATPETCVTCGYVINPATGTEGLFSLYGSSVVIGDGLDIYFYIESSNLNGTDYHAEVVRVRNGITETPKTIPYSEWTKSGQYMRFCYSGIAAKEMTDVVHVTIYKGDQRVSKQCSESVQNYAMRTLNYAPNAGNTELKTTLVDMLNYGAAAQDFFDGYNIDNLATKDLTKEQKQLATADRTYRYAGEGSGFSGSVSAKNKLVFTFYFPDITNVKSATVNYKNKSQVIKAESFRQNTMNGNTVYGVDVTGIAIADGLEKITCTLTYNDDTTKVVSCDVESYVYTVYDKGITDHPVFNMLMHFIDSAHAYFR